MAGALLVVAEAQQRGPEDVEPDDVDELGRPGGGELLVDDDLLDRRAPPAAELARPRAPDVPGRVSGGLPRAEGFDPLVERARQPGRHQLLLGEEVADLLLESALLVCRAKLHLN